jgi:hypothetical protein
MSKASPAPEASQRREALEDGLDRNLLGKRYEFCLSGKHFSCEDCWENFSALLYQIILYGMNPNSYNWREEKRKKLITTCLSAEKLPITKVLLFITQTSTMENSVSAKQV